jgi:hypothetical protein
VIRSEEELREIVAPPTGFVVDKAIDHVDEASRPCRRRGRSSAASTPR